MDDNTITTSIFASDYSFDEYLKDFTLAQPQVSGGGTGTKCELVDYDTVFNSDGHKIAIRSGTSHNFGSFLGIDANESAILRTTEWSLEGQKSSVKTEIQSPHMKAALKAVVPIYRDRNIKFTHISWYGEPRHLFHFRTGLFEYGRQLHLESDEQRHVSLLVEHLQQELADAVASFTSHVTFQPSLPSIEFRHAWTIFRQGDLVYLPGNLAPCGVEMIVRYKAIFSSCSCNDADHMFSHAWTLEGEYLTTNKNGFGFKSWTAKILYFEGIRQIKLLPLLPLRFHPEQEDIKTRLIIRGRKFRQLQGIHHQFYRGLASLSREGGTDTRMFHTADSSSRVLRQTGSRIMLDSQHFHSKEDDGNSIPTSWVFTDNDYLICHSHVAGYTFNERQWGYFSIDLLQNIDFDTATFESSLMLPDKHKNVLLSLVRMQTDHSNLAFSDIIKGKGKGLVFLLHGEPGVGKTMTAAEHCKRPLLKIDARDLCHDHDSTESALKRVLRLAERWNAVALLDEADIFLEQRSRHYQMGNSLVTAFLRILEYFQGVLFLTTNRVNSIDHAFKSRIQVAIHYPKLDIASRKRLWQIFLAKASTKIQNPSSWADLASKFAHEELNGRQMRDIVRIAHAAAFGAGADIGYDHLHNAIDALRTFDEEFEKNRKPIEALFEYRAHKRRRVQSEDSSMSESDY
ncbi:P-loop containing protein [Fusarium mundagurra]|uniref:P-loop containing protein n=1 Tax=Fusarium mundagurra TaxID=1567541 RepID=A0A8H5XSN9_9HYPO|nr:P-loop containing protein [Fusarium mundagurra]